MKWKRSVIENDIIIRNERGKGEGKRGEIKTLNENKVKERESNGKKVKVRKRYHTEDKIRV